MCPVRGCSGYFVWYERSRCRRALDRVRCVDRHIRLPETLFQRDSGQAQLIDWNGDLCCLLDKLRTQRRPNRLGALIEFSFTMPLAEPDGT